MARGMVAMVAALMFCVGMTAEASAQSITESVSLDVTQSAPTALTAEHYVWHSTGDQEAERPQISTGALNTLYVATAVLQALDFHSTQRAQHYGAVEANPIMARITENSALFLTAKSAVAASTILLTRQIAKRNRLAAALTLTVINSAYAMVVRQNYRIAALR
jgi:hypothetical protein